MLNVETAVLRRHDDGRIKLRSAEKIHPLVGSGAAIASRTDLARMRESNHRADGCRYHSKPTKTRYAAATTLQRGTKGSDESHSGATTPSAPTSKAPAKAAAVVPGFNSRHDMRSSRWIPVSVITHPTSMANDTTAYNPQYVVCECHHHPKSVANATVTR